MGPLCSGKTTLLNQLFDTNFLEMVATGGRSSTTKGLWVANSAGAIVLDLQGTSRNGEEDKTKFEKQLIRFAVAAADVVIINMWCCDIVDSELPNEPLFNVFKVMLELPRTWKRTLIFAIRDKPKTATETLMLEVNEGIKKIWGAATKPQGHTSMSDLCDAEVVTLSNFDCYPTDFLNEVDELKKMSCLYTSADGERAWDDIVVQNWDEKKTKNKQPFKLISNVKKIADLSLDDDKLTLMKDSTFGNLSAVNYSRESSALLAKALCRLYDDNNNVIKLNEDTTFTFCSKEVATALGMLEGQPDYADYINEAPSIIRTLFSGFQEDFQDINFAKMQAATVKRILKECKVDNEDRRQRFKILMIQFLLEEVLIPRDFAVRPEPYRWNMVHSLTEVEQVKWPQKITDVLLHGLAKGKRFLEVELVENPKLQHHFSGAFCALEAIMYERIEKLRPDVHMENAIPVAKYKPKRWSNVVGDLCNLKASDITRCPHCVGLTEEEHTPDNAGKRKGRKPKNGLFYSRRKGRNPKKGEKPIPIRKSK